MTRARSRTLLPILVAGAIDHSQCEHPYVRSFRSKAHTLTWIRLMGLDWTLIRSIRRAIRYLSWQHVPCPQLSYPLTHLLPLVP